ncbi:MAG: hypothetical protein K0Q73_9079 [Paenibacillus sp.]|nr:hypothetical protein [Paenibacillus sp.]
MVTWNLASNDELKAIVDDGTIDYTIRIAALRTAVSDDWGK